MTLTRDRNSINAAIGPNDRAISLTAEGPGALIKTSAIIAGAVAKACEPPRPMVVVVVNFHGFLAHARTLLKQAIEERRKVLRKQGQEIGELKIDLVHLGQAKEIRKRPVGRKIVWVFDHLVPESERWR